MKQEHNGDSVTRFVGLVLMILSAAWMALGTLFGLGLAIAWISETGLTEKLQPWLFGVLIVAALSSVVGYCAFVVGRRLRLHG